MVGLLVVLEMGEDLLFCSSNGIYVDFYDARMLFSSPQKLIGTFAAKIF
jgi:hypothetical protein